jgi:hypothetical protein
MRSLNLVRMRATPVQAPSACRSTLEADRNIIPTTMKYYLYISDAKVDMLLPQVPHETKKKIAIDFGMDIKIFRAGRKSEEETEENRVTRLEAVVTFIREFGNVGTVDDPDEYIDDTQPVWWGPLENMAYFSGKTEKTTFALAGSARHLLGAMPDQDVWPFSSNYLESWVG